MGLFVSRLPDTAEIVGYQRLLAERGELPRHNKNNKLDRQTLQKASIESIGLFQGLATPPQDAVRKKSSSEKQNPAGANGGAGKKVVVIVSCRDMPSCHSRRSAASGKPILSPISGQGDVVALLRKLAGRLRRLGPSYRDPEAFHVEKSEIEAELRGLAISLEEAGR